MTTVADIAEPLADICVPVPYQGDGVCLSCHGSPNPGWNRCYSCAQAESQVARPCQLIVPVSLYDIPSQLHHLLRHYKSGVYPTREHDFSLKIISILCHFLARHAGCIGSVAGGGWDVITTVPSSGGRSGEHPLISALRRVPAVFGLHQELLAPGAVTLGHSHADDNGYRLTRGLNGERILLVDDTFTSGARAQSAASTLSLGSGVVVAIVPIGRVVNPQYSDTTREYWDQQRRQRYRFDTCCLEPF